MLTIADFGHPNGSKQGLLNAIQSVGSVCSLPIAPNLCDWIGRQRSILIGSLVVALGAGLQSGARDVGMFIAGRFFSKRIDGDCFSSNSLTTSCSRSGLRHQRSSISTLDYRALARKGLAYLTLHIVADQLQPNQRGKITAVYNTFYYFGSTIAAWTTYGTLQIQSNWSWRLPSLLQVVPSFIQLCLLWLLPESPRW